VVAILWYNPVAQDAFVFYNVASDVLCGCGYIYYGRSILSVLYQGRNRSRPHNSLSIRIILFIICFVSVSYAIGIVYPAHILGGILGHLFIEVVISVLMIFSFFILFFRHQEKKLKSPTAPQQLDA